MKTLLILFVLLISSFFIQAQIIIPFENASPVPTVCGDTWVESGLNHVVTNIPSIASCGLDYNNLNFSSLWLFPALTRIDLSPLPNVSKIEVDVTGHCGSPCANFEVFDSGGTSIFTISETTAPGLETLIFNNPSLIPLGYMGISGLEGEFHEVRIFMEEELCDPKADITTEKGDVYIENHCFGVILTAPNGSCFRVRVNNAGTLISQAVPCP